MSAQHFDSQSDPVLPKPSPMPGIILGVVAVVVIIVLLVLGSQQPTKQASKPAPPPAEEKYTPPAKTTTAPDATTTTKPAPPPAPAPAPKATPSAPTTGEVAAAKRAGTRRATITTDKGVIIVELYGKDAPLTVANFVKLANARFYDGLTFHRVEPGFVIQGGDPDGNGSGGPGYSIKLEISPKLKHINGALAMARSNDPDSAGSQFYITLGAQPALDGKYAVFGKVVKGMDVAQQIAIGDKIVSVRIQK